MAVLVTMEVAFVSGVLVSDSSRVVIEVPQSVTETLAGDGRRYPC